MTTRENPNTPTVATVTAWPKSPSGAGYAVSIRRGEREATTVSYQPDAWTAGALAAELRGALADAYTAGKVDAERIAATPHLADHEREPDAWPPASFTDPLHARYSGAKEGGYRTVAMIPVTGGNTYSVVENARAYGGPTYHLADNPADVDRRPARTFATLADAIAAALVAAGWGDGRGNPADWPPTAEPEPDPAEVKAQRAADAEQA